MPETAGYEALLSQSYRLFGGENNVDIVGVTSSILVTPTILFKHLAAICEVLSRFKEPERASA
jgi:hypothetical protein